MISLSKKFLFVHVPKTAGSSVRKSLAPYSVDRNRTLFRRATYWLPVQENPEKAYFKLHSTSEDIRRKLCPLVFKQLHKFAVVRNPYAHAVSYYFFVKRNVNSNRHKQLQDWSFREFLDYLERKNRIMPRAQSAWLVNRESEIQVDRILFLETFDEDYAALCRYLDVPQEELPPRVNVGTHANYREYYDDTLRCQVERLYAADFENFGYSFESEKPTRNPRPA
ncbi:MAG: sulfotransferase family 2 domain-containing protein [Sulfitobacter sp.]